MKSIHIIQEALKNKHNFNCFCISILSRNKSDDNEKRDRLRFEENPKARKKAKHLCSFCKKNVLEVNGSNTIHHIIPERYSGDYKQKNLLVICMNCHNLLEKCINAVEREAIKHTLIYLRKKQTGGNRA